MNPKWAGCKQTDAALWYRVEIRRSSKEVSADLSHILYVIGFHGSFDGTSYFHEPTIIWQGDGLETITVHEELEARVTR